MVSRLVKKLIDCTVRKWLVCFKQFEYRTCDRYVLVLTKNKHYTNYHEFVGLIYNTVSMVTICYHKSLLSDAKQ